MLYSLKLHLKISLIVSSVNGVMFLSVSFARVVFSVGSVFSSPSVFPISSVSSIRGVFLAGDVFGGVTSVRGVFPVGGVFSSVSGPGVFLVAGVSSFNGVRCRSKNRSNGVMHLFRFR